MKITQFIALLAFVCTIQANAQISAGGTNSLGKPALRSDVIDTLIIYKDTTGANITWNAGTPGSFVWKRYTPNNPSGTTFTTTDSIYVSSGTSTTLPTVQEGGYIITHYTTTDTTTKVVWATLYNDHAVLAIDTVIIDDSGRDSLYNPCKTLYLEVSPTQDSFFYYGPPASNSGALRYLNEVHYAKGVSNGDSVVFVDAPYNDGPITINAYEQFQFAGNILSSSFGDTTAKTTPYTAIAIQSEIEPQFSGTDNPPLNEVGNLVKQGKQYSVSVPTDLTLSTSTADPSDFYMWNVYQLTDTVKNEITTYDGADFTFPLTYADTFLVHLNVSRERPRMNGDLGICDCNDSIRVIAYSSLVAAPNTFTPNGDGINDEFKVAYRSLKSFEGYIYNRWGKKVFQWTNPAEGWNGKINGSGADAPPGAYFYKIKAVGTESGHDVTHVISGDINLIRPK